MLSHESARASDWDLFDQNWDLAQISVSHVNDSSLSDGLAILKSRRILNAPSDLHLLSLDKAEPIFPTLAHEVQIRENSSHPTTQHAKLVGSKLLLFVSPAAAKPRRTIACSYAALEKFPASSVEEFHKANPALSAQLESQIKENRVCVYHADGFFTLSTSPTANAEWASAIRESLANDVFTPDQMAAKDAAFTSLNPALFSQIVNDYESKENLLNHLVEEGFEDDTILNQSHPMNSAAKIKFGKLEIELTEEELESSDSAGDDTAIADAARTDAFAKMYCVLLPGHLYAFKDSADDKASGHLSTDAMSVARDGERGLMITTPARSLRIKCAHEFELFDWIIGLMNSSSRNDCGKVLGQLHEDLEAKTREVMREKLPIGKSSMHLQVHYTNKEKQKMVTKRNLKTGQNVLGRDPSVEIIIDDGGLSRAHCKIVIGEEGARLVDMGSSNGVRVNLERVNPTAGLTGGDVLLLGTSCIISVGAANAEHLEKAVQKLEEEKASSVKRRTLRESKGAAAGK